MATTTKSRKAKAPRTVYIVGFAPSWEKTPWGEPDAAYWGLNDLHMLGDAGKKPWTRWFQLHDIDKHHEHNADTHIGWLNQQDFETLMFEDHIDDRLTNTTPYPKSEIVSEFGGYFTNSISWMIALAIHEGYEKIGIYGVDMAQDSEYGHQRPSCEYFVGIAEGKGIVVEVAEDSDLLKAPFLYGAEEGGPLRRKLENRMKELTERRGQLAGQSQTLQLQIANLDGAIEDTRYYLRAWSVGEISDGPEPLPQEAES